MMQILNMLSSRNELHGSSRPLSIACLGDSITHGCFETYIRGDGSWDCRYDAEAVYHARWRDKMLHLFPRVSMHIINAGISGDNAPGGLQRLERDVLSFKPDFIMICYGLNDVMHGERNLFRYQQALEEIFARIKEQNIPFLFIRPNMMNTEVDSSITDQGLKNMAGQASLLQCDVTKLSQEAREKVLLDTYLQKSCPENYEIQSVMDFYMHEAACSCAKFGVPICDFYGLWKKLYYTGTDITRFLSNYINHPVPSMHDLLADMLLQMVLSGTI